MDIREDLLVGVDKTWIKLIEDFNDQELQYHINNDKYIPGDKIFRAFKYFDIESTIVVILGQDPYPNEGDACGLSFSVERNEKLPHSLRNIFKELKDDLGIDRKSGNLEDWAEQGVLLLNTALTISKKENGKQISYISLWKKFINYVIANINKKSKAIFVLWGNDAKGKKELIAGDMYIESGHPSFAHSHKQFFNTKPFSKVNQYIKNHKLRSIKW
ncbi:MAG: uracil-DNA glycosylase [Mycoplasmataceae bacterium]|jgi:uracil-DNA glycosylase|nr:uracil-DNA glycosylase [Mycoplasmataceae bacterium]